MAVTFTRVQNEKLVAAQKDMIGSISESINKLYENAFAVSMYTTGDRTIVTFQIQNEDGSISTRSITFSSTLFNVKEN
jgi:sugar-specific transcriptional regulator TrmB